MRTPARVLVTGAGGFVGREVVRVLRAHGHEIHGVGRSPARGITVDHWHSADLLVPGAAASIAQAAQATHLLHLAWCTDHGRFWRDPANLDWGRATFELLDAFTRAGGQRAVVAGSCSQYDWSDAACTMPLDEMTSPRRPHTLYGTTKQAVEAVASAYATETGLSFAMGIIFLIYGPHENPERLVPVVTRQLLAGVPALATAGIQVRDFLHVRDCAAALVALFESSVGGAVNIASGVGHRVGDVVELLGQLLGRPELVRLGALPGRVDEPQRLVAATSRLRDEVGFAPTLDLETGLTEVVRWWDEHRRTTAD